jgi:hypothetical protein
MHSDAALEDLVGVEVQGASLATASLTGPDAAEGGGFLLPLLAALQRTPADLSTAIAEDPTRNLELAIFAARVSGVSPDDLRNAFLAVTNPENTDEITMAGKSVMRIPTGWTTYVHVAGDVLVIVQTPQVDLAEEVLGQLP